MLATVAGLQAVWPVSDEALRDGLSTVTARTGLKGRFQTLQEHPLVIADTAHNQPGLAALLETIQSIHHARLRIIMGVVADKDRQHVLAVLPPTADFYFCQAQSPRSLPAASLQAEAAAIGLKGRVFTDVNAALAAALQDAATDDLLLVTGSNYIIAELTTL